MLREVARVLRPGGRFVHVGVHPCFVGAFADWGQHPRVVVDARYADRSRSFDSWNASGVRVRVGAWHLPLADLVNATVAAASGCSGSPRQAQEESPTCWASSPSERGDDSRPPRAHVEEPRSAQIRGSCCLSTERGSNFAEVARILRGGAERSAAAGQRRGHGEKHLVATCVAVLRTGPCSLGCRPLTESASGGDMHTLRTLPRRLLAGSGALLITTALATTGIPVPAGAATGADTVGYVRLAHLSPDTPAVDVYLAAPDSTKPRVFPGVGYGVVSDYLELAPGPVRGGDARGRRPRQRPPGAHHRGRGDQRRRVHGGRCRPTRGPGAAGAQRRPQRPHRTAAPRCGSYRLRCGPRCSTWPPPTAR